MAADPRVKIYFKKKIVIDHLTFQQRQMFQLGTVGLASRKNEISHALNAQGNPAKPLSKRYAIKKSRYSKNSGGVGRNRRDLRLSGDMIREWSVRTVNNRQAVATWSTRRGREKAQANNQIEEFISWSPANTRDSLRAGQQMLDESIPRLVLEKQLNG